MPEFSYRARSQNGKLLKGSITAPSCAQAAAELMQNGRIPSLLLEKSGFSYLSIVRRFGERWGKVDIEELMLFTSRLKILFRAGIPLVECFSGLIDQSDKPRFKKTLAEIRTKLEGGMALHESMRHYPRIFSETYVNMIMAGEISGALDESLERLTSLLEMQFDARNKIKEVTRYPKIVLASIAAAMVVLLTFVVPSFTNIFRSAGLELPLPTKILITLNDVFQDYRLTGLVALIAVYLLFKRYISTESGRLRWHQFLLRAPVIGETLLKITFGRFCYVFANLIKSGVPILQSIDVAANSTGNRFLVKIFREVGESVKEGTGMAEPLKRFKIVPPVVIQMIAAGESSGSLDEMLVNVAGYFHQEADRKIKRLSALSEPVLIIVLGGMVLFIALAIFMPMWDMTKIAARG